MTKEEGKIQARLRKTAKKKRKVVKVGYQNLTENGKVWLWDGKTGISVPKDPNH